VIVCARGFIDNNWGAKREEERKEGGRKLLMTSERPSLPPLPFQLAQGRWTRAYLECILDFSNLQPYQGRNEGQQGELTYPENGGKATNDGVALKEVEDLPPQRMRPRSENESRETDLEREQKETY
jgi:hypothetical protein